jgi:hypothetical protein
MPGICTHCGRPLAAEGGLEICLYCNQIATIEDLPQREKIPIECPGATLYDVETGRVVGGVQWVDPDDFSRGFDIVEAPVYAPNHTARRLIEPGQVGKIVRCQACQDFTVRMRANQRPHPSPEGPSAARRKAENLFKD